MQRPEERLPPPGHEQDADHHQQGATGDLDAAAVVSMEFLYLVRLGLRQAHDPRIRDTLRVSGALLEAVTPNGTAYHRYNEDGYGEHRDGSPYDGRGVGRGWPLLTGERGHYDLCLGLDPLPYLEMMARMTGPGGMIPEQIWDAAPIPARGLQPGKPTGSAMPLAWAHAEFLKLLVAREQGRPIELLRCVEERYRARSPAGTWHWRRETPITELPPHRDLVIEAAEAFVLHHGFDGWRDIGDRSSTPLPFGRHAVRLSADELTGRAVLDFTCRFAEPPRWEGADHHVRLAQDGFRSDARRHHDAAARDS